MGSKLLAAAIGKSSDISAVKEAEEAKAREDKGGGLRTMSSVQGLGQLVVEEQTRTRAQLELGAAQLELRAT